MRSSAELPDDRSHFSKGTERPSGAYAALKRHKILQKTLRQRRAERLLLRKRGGPLSQRWTGISNNVFEKHYALRLARPIFRDLTEPRRQIMERQGLRIPPPSPVIVPKGKKSGLGAFGGPGHNLNMAMVAIAVTAKQALNVPSRPVYASTNHDPTRKVPELAG